MRSTRLVILISILLVMTALSAVAQKKVQQKIPDRTRILFLLDGSGSMMGQWKGGQSRIDIAKNILTNLVDSLRSNEQLELALRVYGHRYHRQSNNCQDTKLEVPFGVGNHDQIIQKLGEVVPKGVTPITYSLEQAALDFPDRSEGYRNILILITDGIESCGGDPCSTSLALQKKGIFLRPYVIGLGLEGAKALDCVGKYFDSQDEDSFTRVLKRAIETSFAKTSVSVVLLDGEGKPRESNVNISFVNEATGTAAYEFVHYLDARGRPDTVQIDPVLSYTVVVNTVPPVVQNNVSIVNGRHNQLTIPAPQGTLLVVQENRRASFPVVVRQQGSRELLNSQLSNDAFRYLAGNYRVETLTLPKRFFDVEIKADEQFRIVVPSPGLVNINTISKGHGSLFEIMDDGTEQWVCHLGNQQSKFTYELLPGQYKIAFRVDDAGGSKYTGIKTFQLEPGQTLNISLFN